MQYAELKQKTAKHQVLLLFVRAAYPDLDYFFGGFSQVC
jgi:hypothetical protein